MNLPNWTFEIREISPNIYRVQAEHLSGARIDLTGTDLENLIATAKESATSMEKELDRLGKNREANSTAAISEKADREDLR